MTISRAPVRSSLRSCVLWSWPLTNCWFSIGSLAHFRLTCCKQGWVVRKRVKADLVQKWFSLLLFCVFWDYANLKQKLRRINMQKSSLQSCKTQIETLAYPRLSLRLVSSAFEQPGPGGAPLLGLAVNLNIMMAETCSVLLLSLLDTTCHCIFFRPLRYGGQFTFST